MGNSNGRPSPLRDVIKSDHGKKFARAIGMSAKAFVRDCESALTEKPVVLEACVALHENSVQDFGGKLWSKGLGPAHARVLAFFLARNTSWKRFRYVY